MSSGHAVEKLSLASARSTMSELRSAGWRVIELPPHIRDAQAFLRALLANDLPLDPPIETLDNWDAFTDSFTAGLQDFNEERVAILWPNPAVMAIAAPRDHAELLGLLSEALARSSEWERTRSPIQLRIMVGDG
jgi:hypothetical protein